MRKQLNASIAIASILLTLSACGAYMVHPGATSIAESKAYDVVNDAKNIIDVTRPQLASGALPPRFKPAFNALVDAYNVAFPALKASTSALNAGLNRYGAETIDRRSGRIIDSVGNI